MGQNGPERIARKYRVNEAGVSLSSSNDKTGPVDFNASLVKKLQSDLSSALQTRDDITKGSRSYWQRVHSVHEAVLALLEASSLKELIAKLQNECAHALGMEAVQLLLCSKAGAPILPLAPPVPLSLKNLQKETVVADDALLVNLFESQGGGVAAAMALPLAGETFQGVLLLGARDATRFEAGQANEPFLFLAHVIERLVASCLKVS